MTLKSGFGGGEGDSVVCTTVNEQVKGKGGKGPTMGYCCACSSMAVMSVLLLLYLSENGQTEVKTPPRKTLSGVACIYGGEKRGRILLGLDGSFRN